MQKRHRIFIAINLPTEVKKDLSKYQQKWLELPAKWIPLDNLHITLSFLGDISDEELGDVCVIAREVAKSYYATDITLDAVSYGPKDKIPPRYIWVGGKKNEEIQKLKNDLESALLEKVKFIPESRGFTPHITLARISVFEWRQIEPEERPEVSETIDMPFTVESIEVMESELKRGGPQYTIIESIQLK